MKIVKTPCEMQDIARKVHACGKSIAVVPTMGYLHEGHLSLVDRAKKEASCVVLTLFVNPIQFGPNEDYEVYPRDAERDAKLCEERGVDFLYMPEVSDMYAPNASVFIDETSLSTHLCGAVRPGHFRGVCTVVTKLFNEIAPKYAARKEELGQGGGYTRIYLLGERRGDGAEMAVIELV